MIMIVFRLLASIGLLAWSFQLASAFAQVAPVPTNVPTSAPASPSTSALQAAPVIAPVAPAEPELNTKMVPALSDAAVAPSGKRGGYVPAPNASAAAQAPVSAAAIGDLWHRIRLGFQMDDRTNETIVNWESKYASQPDYLRRLSERGGKYLFHIVEEVEKRNLPTEIALLPVIESAFVAKAQSHAQASGIWQFIPSTGKVFGLDQNYWVDNRRDVIQATRAALDYLQKLHGMFGSWELAFAAYNCGEGCVGRAVAANQKAGLATDFWSLNLPIETKNYVPKLLAVKNIVSSPATYGVALTNIDNESYFARIAAPAMDVKLAAQFAEMRVDDFIALNPAFNRAVAKSHDGHLLLPKDKVDTFNFNLAKHRSPLVTWRQATIGRGESLANFAKRYGTTVAVLKANNYIRERKGRALYAATLVIPGAGASAMTGAQFASVNGLSASAATSANGSTVIEATPLASANAPLATLSATAPPANTTVASTLHTVSRKHTVRRGESLIYIANKYRVSVGDIQRWSGLRGSAINIGQSIVVGQSQVRVAAKTGAQPVQRASTAKPRQLAKAKQAKFYSVRNGDTLGGIAGKFGLSLTDLCRMNGVKPTVKLALNRKLRVG